ncbi:MAG: non-heme iron oxygenase ferredoxin subunit [Spirochaetales bacterium]|nr:non-heme iron oxygenase ferredoxin subunit [Spirochaetales bacterium]
MAEWVRLASEKEVDPVYRVDYGSREIALFRDGEEIFALDNVCSHEYSSLADGEVWDGRVYCAKHGSSFDIRTGAVGGLPATEPVESFPVKIENGLVYVRLEEPW